MLQELRLSQFALYEFVLFLGSCHVGTFLQPT